jgi:hypothetical protein
MTAKRKPVPPVAWAVVRREDGRVVYTVSTEEGAKSEARLHERANPGDKFRAALLTERSPAEAAVIRAAMKWFESHRVDDYAKQDDANNALDSAVSRLKVRR